MPKRVADVKWGIMTTEHMQDVADYSYSETAFLESIPGSEELSAYKNEAASF